MVDAVWLSSFSGASGHTLIAHTKVGTRRSDINKAASEVFMLIVYAKFIVNVRNSAFN